MSVAPDLQNTFFLTRQSANVMEDLFRQLSQAGMVCLLYGSKGVGKSRLLEQFVSSRLVQDKIVFVEFDNSGNFHSVSTPEQPWKVEEFVPKLLQPSESNSIFLIDQFEQAPPDIIAAIFHYWQLEARLKDQKLILTSSPDKLQQLLELSQKSSISINSVELKPLSANEQLEFIRSRCCPGHAQQPLLNRQQKLQLKQSQGLFNQLVLLQKQWSGQVECREQQQKRPMTVPAILVLVVIALGVLVWTLYPDEPVMTFESVGTQKDPIQVTQPEAPAVTEEVTDTSADSQQTSSIEQAPEVTEDRQSELVEQPEPADTGSPVAAADDDTTASMVEEPAETETEMTTLAIADEPVSEPVEEELPQPLAEEAQPVTTADVDSSNAQSEATAEPLTDTEQPAVDAEPVMQAPAIVEPEPEPSLYQQRLRASEQWLTQSADSTSSIQLMLLGFEIDAEQAIEQYLQGLLAKDIDTDNIMLYATVKNQRSVIGVLYGIYPDRQQARQNIRSLPRALNANKPIIRTVKGIKDEIRSDRLQ